MINVTGISITDEGAYLQTKDLPEEINFPEDLLISQRQVEFLIILWSFLLFYEVSYCLMRFLLSYGVFT